MTARLQAKAAREAERAARRVARAERRAARHEAKHGPSDATEGTPASETEPSTSATALRGCRLTISPSSKRVAAGETVSLSGSVTCPAGASAASASAAGRVVTITRRKTGAGPAPFAVAATATTDADGLYTVAPMSVEQNTVFRARLGTSSHGAQTAVKVAPVVTLSGPEPTAQSSVVGAPAAHGARTKATFTGTVTPTDTGEQVALQVAYPGNIEQWRTVALGHVGADGAYSIKHGFRITGAMSVRTVARTWKLHVPAVSNVVAYEAPQPQNPLLTIHASADPISAGESVTISGVAAAGAGQAVTLLARVGGGSFATVATGTTDPSGAYSFTQAPTVNTSYLVSDASAKSAVVFEGVRRVVTVGAAPSTLAIATPLTLSGTVSPAAAGQRVYLETQNPYGFSFHVLAVASVGADGSYTIAESLSNAREYVLRVKTPADANDQAGASAPFKVAVGATGGGPAAAAPIE
ncbi:MAG TPA: hypothetical protein VK605_09395 [Solirubrobacteraceae bacterium]|nr:hypothetical protein [Solirubrobacteraceae bacterium]